MTVSPIKAIAMRDAILMRIRDAMAEDNKVFFVTADFGSPVIDDIRSKHADRFVNVGVAEQNLINVSAGLALEGFNVFAYAIAPFITMRCFEQIRVNLCLLSQVRSMSVNLIGVGAGYSYVVSGPTHQCYEDISIMRTLPAVQVFSPSDHVQTDAVFDRCSQNGIRYIRLDAQVLPVIERPESVSSSRGFNVLRAGRGRVAMISTGFMTHTALKVAADLEAQGVLSTIIDLCDLSRFNAVELADALRDADLVVSMEEGFSGCGGVDALVQRLIREQNLDCQFLPIGVRPGYNFELGSRAELHEQVGIGHSVCVQTIMSTLSQMVN